MSGNTLDAIISAIYGFFKGIVCGVVNINPSHSIYESSESSESSEEGFPMNNSSFTRNYVDISENEMDNIHKYYSRSLL